MTLDSIFVTDSIQWEIQKPKSLALQLSRETKIIEIGRVVQFLELLQKMKKSRQEISEKRSKIIKFWSLFVKSCFKDNSASFDRINKIFDSLQPQNFFLKVSSGCR